MRDIIPPLSQSLVEVGSCPESYLFQREGNKQADSIQSERGTEVHFVAAAYTRHCVKHRVPVDFAYFDKLSAAAGPVAGPILDNLRDTFVVKFDSVLATEVRLRLDEDLNPTLFEEERDDRADGVTTRIHPEDEMPGVSYSTKDAAHAGTLDVISVNEDLSEGFIDDYKSHPRPFEPDTYQSELYPFMAFKHIPTLQKVTFTLIFVRYGFNVRRSVVWTREDMPEMATRIKRARERQLALEAAGEGPALPGSHCNYCPKITKPTLCSISEFNPNINTDPAERYRFMLWADNVRKVNVAAMKDHVDATGKPISIFDANGKQYEYGIQPTEVKVFPLDETSITLIRNHIAVSPKDTWEDMKLLIGSTKLKSLLKAKFRAGLKDALEDSVVEMVTKPRFASRMPDGQIDEGAQPWGDD